jgi:hypothetical protein
MLHRNDQATSRSVTPRRTLITVIALVASLALVGLTPSTGAEEMAQASAEPEDPTAGATGAWTITFRAEQRVPEEGMIRVIFPPGFATSNSTACQRSEGNTTIIMETFVVNGREVVCRLGQTETIEPHETFTVNITLMTNPEDDGETGNFLIQTRDAEGNGLDHHATATAIIEPRKTWLSALQVRAPAQTTGTQEEWTLSIRPEAGMESIAALRVNVPDGFTPIDDPEETCTQDSNGTVVKLERDVNQTLVSCLLDPAALPAANATAAFRLGSFLNPVLADLQYLVDVDLIGDDGQVQEAAAMPVAVHPHPFTTGPDHHSPDRVVGAVTEHRFNLTTFNPWEPDGLLVVHFPSDYVLLEAGPEGLHVTTPANASVAFGLPEAHGNSLFIPRAQSGNATSNDTSNNTTTPGNSTTPNNTTTPGGAIVTFTVHGIQNPDVPGVPSAIILETRDAESRIHDRGDVDPPAIVELGDVPPSGQQDDPPSFDPSAGNQTQDNGNGTNPNPAGPFDNNATGDRGGAANGLGFLLALAAVSTAMLAVRRRRA